MPRSCEHLTIPVLSACCDCGEGSGGKGLQRYAMHVVSKIYHLEHGLQKHSQSLKSQASIKTATVSFWISDCFFGVPVSVQHLFALCSTAPVSVPVRFLLELVAHDLYLVWLSLVAFEPGKHAYSAEAFGPNRCN